jgi:hypothetical protein
MKTSMIRLLYILFLATIFSSCVNVKNKKEIKEIPLNIVVTDKIGNVASDKLPLEIDSLFAPIEPGGCPKVAFLPKVEIIRYGFPKAYYRVINTDGSGWKTFFQKFYGNTGVETQKSNIKKALEEFALGDSLVLANSMNLSLNQIIEKVNNSNPSSLIYILNSELNSTTYKSGNREIAVCKNVKSLLDVLANQLCDKKAKTNFKIVILYNPQMEGKNDSIPHVKQDSLQKAEIDNKVSSSKEKTEKIVKDKKDKTDQDSSDSSTTHIAQGKTLTLPNGDKYVGEVVNNKPNGWGTVTFSVSRLISEDDPKKTIAEAGDSFTGVWIDGKPQSGKLYDSKKNIKSTLAFGVAK